MVRKFLAAVLAAVFCLLCAGTALAKDRDRDDRVLKVITRNMDGGSDFGYVLTATDTTSAIIGVTATYQEMLQSNFPERADGIASEIQSLKPDLVGLQEVTKILNGPYGGPATNVVVDQLDLLMQALAMRGLHYKAIAVQANADVELPAFAEYPNLMDVRLIDYDAVLARTDVPDLKIKNITAEHFNTILELPVLGYEIPFWRGWIAVDAKYFGKPFRFVTTHLETFSNAIQQAQAIELVNGPLAVHHPVILAGDLNSDALDPDIKDNSPAYYMLTTSGFIDVWHLLRPCIPGPTWPLHAEDPPNAATEPFQRIDLILDRGHLTPIFISRFGNTASSLTPSGLWPSDHAGVVADFVLWPEW